MYSDTRPETSWLRFQGWPPTILICVVIAAYVLVSHPSHVILTQAITRASAPWTTLSHQRHRPMPSWGKATGGLSAYVTSSAQDVDPAPLNRGTLNAIMMAGIGAASIGALAYSRRKFIASLSTATLLLPLVPSPAVADDSPAPRPSYPQRIDPVVAQQQYEQRLLEENNKRIQAINRVPGGFPAFVRDGFTVQVKVSEAYTTLPSGLIVYDFPTSNQKGPTPQDGQKVVFHYTAYNENGARIDSSYLGGRPLEQVVGIGGMVPGFEEGIKGMHIGGQRRLVIPPELGPPTGPSTFFSAKQYEVFDVELLDILDCQREGFSFMSRLVCTKGPV